MTRRVTILTLAVVSLAGAACSSASRPGATGAAGTGAAPLPVTITATSCDPGDLRADPGSVTMTVTNRGAGPGAAFSVLSGDVVLGRLEPVTEGQARTITLDLPAGTYRTACRSSGAVAGGTLTVGAGSGAAQLGQAEDLQVAVTTYRASLQDGTNHFAAAARRLHDVIAAGDLAAARVAYADARRAYEPVKAAAANFGESVPDGPADLDQQIDPPADPTAGGGTGLHAIEHGLFADGSTAGLEPAAAAVVTGAQQLAARVTAVQLTAGQVAGGLAGPLGALVTEALTGRAEPSSHLDLLDARATVEGTRTALVALRAPLERRDRDLAATVAARLAVLDGALEAVGSGDAAPPAASARPVAQAIDALADAVAQIPAALARPVAP